MEDQEKLRKRQREVDQAEAKGQLKSKASSIVGVKAPAAVPSEEEVEEFFEILRRMHVAVRYFGKKINGDGRFSGKLREALESGWIKFVTPITSEGDHGNRQEPADDAEAPASDKNQIFDLNNEPDQEIVELAEATNTGA